MEKIFREIQFCQTRLVSEKKAKVVNIEISVKIEPFLKLHVSKSGGHLLFLSYAHSRYRLFQDFTYGPIY